MSSSLRRIFALGAAAAVMLTVSGAGTPTQADGNQSCDVPNRRMTLYAQELERTPEGEPRLAWGTTPTNGTIPGPLIEMYEGECLAITVVNDVPESTLAELRDHPVWGSKDPSMPLGVSLHVHGVKYTQASDGTIQTDSYVPSGQSRTYYWYAAPRVSVGGRIVSQGTAGYWWYHDHVIGTDHGTGGLYTGLFGGLVVRRLGDIEPDRSFTVAMGPNATINLKRWPDVGQFVATEGERVEFVVIGVGDEFHTFHLHAHNWADNRTGILQTQADETQMVDNKTIGPAESFGFQIIAGQEVGPGQWMLHCHVQLHSDLGMFTFFNVLPANGPLPGVSSQVTPQDHVHYGRGG